MAVHALKPAASPANTDRTRFNLGLPHCTNAATGRDALPYPSSIESKLDAAHAVDFIKCQLAERPVPDLAALVTSSASSWRTLALRRWSPHA